MGELTAGLIEVKAEDTRNNMPTQAKMARALPDSYAGSHISSFGGAHGKHKYYWSDLTDQMHGRLLLLRGLADFGILRAIG